MSDTTIKLQHLREKIQNQDFQHSRGLSNEVSYYILGYEPQDQPMVREAVDNMKRQLTRATAGIDIIEFKLK